jgi:hypothetical protein
LTQRPNDDDQTHTADRSTSDDFGGRDRLIRIERANTLKRLRERWEAEEGVLGIVYLEIS